MLREMGDRGRAYVQEHFDRSHAAQSYLELLRELHRLAPTGTTLMAGADTNPFSPSHPDNDLRGPSDGIFKLIRSDYRRYRASGASAAGTVLLTQGFWASAVYRLHHHLVRRCPWPIARTLARALGLVLHKGVEIFTGISLPGGLEAGAGLYIGHFGNIIVSPEARLGRNCNLSQGITIGMAGRGERRGAPVLGDRVFVGVGAILLGPIHIGDDVAIGAGAVVTKSVPARAVVVGNPARVISDRGSFDFISYDRMEADPARRPGDSSPASLAPEVAGLEWRKENSRAMVPENEAQGGDSIKNF
jgi:serine O-acetyltransferase